ncbi:MAG: hypothetical protein RBR24_06300 [Candidatus Carbobacillus sp.]|nr:hypothetical protein [Candidatus Carbobacillus sp.]
MQAGGKKSIPSTSPLIEQIMSKIREDTPWAYPDMPVRKKRFAQGLQIGMGVLVGLLIILAASLYQQGQIRDVQHVTENTLSPVLMVGSMTFAKHFSATSEDERLTGQFMEALADARVHAFYRAYWPTVTMNVSFILLLMGVVVLTMWMIWWFRRTE